jgi:two-component system, sensor histidine kinase
MVAATPLLNDRARAEAVAEVFRVVAIGVLGAALAAVGTSAIFIRLGITEAWRGGLFAAFICTCALTHILLRMAYVRDACRSERWRFWGRAFVALALVEGIGWGWCPVGLVTNGDLAAELIALFVTLSVATGAMVAFGAYMPAFLALFIPATIPVAVHNAMSQNALLHAMSFLLVIYIVAMGVVGISASTSFQRLVQLRLRAETLADELSDQIGIAEAANRAKSSFLAAASHDLRQPVHALGLLVGALRGMALPLDARRILERMEVSTQALDSLFIALLDISRLDAGTVEVSERAFPVGAMLERICRDHARDAQDKGIDLVLVRGTLACRSDPILIERVVRNLVANAVRYTQTGRVLVGSRRRADRVSIEVWDTGPGIAVEQRDRIFQEYYQVGNAERDRSKGLGLGLAIVRRLTTLLECPLTLRSTPGRGSCFSILVPRAGGAVAEPQPAAEAEPAFPTQRRLIVVIEDEIEIRAAMSALLERWGHQAITAENGAAAIARLADCPTKPDLIISDLRLRGSETGLKVIEMLRSEYNETIPAILVTGDTAPERLVEARDSGLLILHKPVSNGRLRAAIGNSLAAEMA